MALQHCAQLASNLLSCVAIANELVNWTLIDFLAEAIQRDPMVSLMKTNRPTVDTIQSYRKAPATTVNK